MLSNFMKDEHFFETLFRHFEDNTLLDHSFFISFHRTMFVEALQDAGIGTIEISAVALTEAYTRTFMDIGFLLQPENYVGAGKYLKRGQIDYRTNIFEVMAFTVINILRRAPILSVSPDASVPIESVVALAASQPNEYAVLATYDQIARRMCRELDISAPEAPFGQKLSQLIAHKDEFVFADSSFSLMTEFLRR